MWSYLGILIAALGIACLEVPSLLRRQMKKELLVFSVLLLAGTGLSFAYKAKVPIPNPLDWISFIYKPASDALFTFLK